MDFLDPKAARRHQILLLIGYGLIAIAITGVSLVLLYRSSGYTLKSNGNVLQSGLVFTSSQPTGAKIYLNQVDSGRRTNTKLDLTSGQYNLRISRDGYTEWQRDITVDGGKVIRFDYPMLFPKKPVIKGVGEHSKVAFATQSPNKRWLLLADGTRQGVIAQYDIKVPDKPNVSEFTIPSSVITLEGDNHQWEVIEWASSSNHVLLLHNFSLSGIASHEYILLNRDSPLESRNVTRDIDLTPEETVTLHDKRVQRYYVYSPTTKLLRLVTADNATASVAASNVIAYKTYGNDKILYITDNYPAGKPITSAVYAVLQEGVDRTAIRKFNASAETYLLNMAEYDNKWYVAVGSSNDKGVYIYLNPQSLVKTNANTLPGAWRFLGVDKPNYLAFSDNTRFILAEMMGNLAFTTQKCPTNLNTG